MGAAAADCVIVWSEGSVCLRDGRSAGLTCAGDERMESHSCVRDVIRFIAKKQHGGVCLIALPPTQPVSPPFSAVGAPACDRASMTTHLMLLESANKSAIKCRDMPHRHQHEPSMQSSGSRWPQCPCVCLLDPLLVKKFTQVRVNGGSNDGCLNVNVCLSWRARPTIPFIGRR